MPVLLGNWGVCKVCGRGWIRSMQVWWFSGAGLGVGWGWGKLLKVWGLGVWVGRAVGGGFVVR